MFKNLWKNFWGFYEKYYLLNLTISAGLFSLQLIHLYWLAAHVISLKIFGQSYFPLNSFWQTIIILVDYTEIPALIATSLIYINEIRKANQEKNKLPLKSLLFLLFLNTQWIHILWITDEFVVDQFAGNITGHLFAGWLAWIAIGIDYLELPVIYDTIKQIYSAIKNKDKEQLLEALKE